MTNGNANVSSPATWVREARLHLGLSVRELARLADVSYPTVSRIENGHEEPRWDTLVRLLRATGRSLDSAEPRALPIIRLADLTTHWRTLRSGRHEPDWTSLRTFADRLHLHPELTAAAIIPTPKRSGSKYYDSLLAGIAEKCADDAGIRRPAWTKTRPALDTPWEGLGTPQMLRRNREQAPPQFRARGLHISESTIWRTHLLRVSKSGAQRRAHSQARRGARRSSTRVER